MKPNPKSHPQSSSIPSAHQQIYAHSLRDTSPEHWHPLSEHCEQVAILAAEFAKPFKSEHWAYLIGLLHDIGKARASFQSYLLHCNGLEDPNYDGSEHSHSGVGAVLAKQKLKHCWPVFAYCVAGHHAGLPDWTDGETPNGSLNYRLQEEENILNEPPLQQYIASNSTFLENPSLLPPWKFMLSDVSFWIRMLYSCLVDADFLDTEAFMDSTRAKNRGKYPTLPELADKFFAALNDKETVAPKTPINKLRASIRQACEAAALYSTGIFSLTVPTGGGKTLSGTAFAVRHALQHNQRRIIYVIPYTSIVEQTADVLRSFFGADNVVEHHSNFEPNRDTRQDDLATENWDAPIIVTTNVQFFESLYACRSSRCRKLHNIANSVVILDEAQLLPENLLLPCIEALKQLSANYGTTILLSTATQPSLPGLENVREIIPSDLDLYQQLKRVTIEIPEDLNACRTWEEIAGELKKYPQVLCIVNSRKDCYALHAIMPPDTIHLSALMCGAHRSEIIKAIKDKLSAGEPIRVISTQLVEAGVDINFPVVYRAFTGLPSIAQAAGRCNREGNLPGLGKVVVFMPPEPSKVALLRKSEDTMRDLLAADLDVESPESYPKFFEHFYKKLVDMGKNFDDWLTLNASYMQFQFREAAAKFRIIDQISLPIIIRYKCNGKLIESLIAAGPKRDIMRRLQRYTITLPRGMILRLKEKGFIEEPHNGVFIQTMSSLYNNKTGFDVFRDDLNPEELML